MPFDLFISYARRDNAPLKNGPGPVSQLVSQISRDFERFAGRPLRPFFDTTAINGMDDWRHSILQGLRESRLLLVCLSPSYLASEYCQWEFIEYLNHEVARGFVGEGVAPLYFVEVPGWQSPDFEQRCAEWVADLRRRQVLDLRPWFNEGEAALRHAEVKARMEQLTEQVATRIQRGERAEQSLGNVDARNPNFIGRTTELRRLRESVALGKVGMLTAIHGLGGMGKTALAIEYAHAFAHEYGGGRWQVRCEGRGNLAAAIATLAPALAIEFTDDEQLDSNLQFDRVLAELQILANSNEPHRCLLVLDNVDQPKLLEPAQTKRLASADWLHVIATTRLGGSDLFERHKDRAFLAVDELPEDDAVELIESFQPGGTFPDDAERNAAREIAQRLGRFTLAVESAAVYLGQFAGDVTCSGFLARLKEEGLEGLESATRETTEGLLHGEKSLAATLRPTLDRLTAPEQMALTFGALLPADQIALPWIRVLLAKVYSDLGTDAQPGYPDPWQNLLRRLVGLRLLQPTAIKDASGQPLLVRMHRLLQELQRNSVDDLAETLEQTLLEHIEGRAAFLSDGWIDHEHRWELAPLAACARQWLDREGDAGPTLAYYVAGPLGQLGNYAESERLLRRSVEKTAEDNPNYAFRLNNLSMLLQATNRLEESEKLMRRAQVIIERNYDPLDPIVATVLNNLAHLLQATNRLAEAEPLRRRAVKIAQQSFGPDDPTVALYLNNLGDLLKETNRLAEAEPLIRRALEIDEKSYGPVHPNVIRDISSLTALLQETNRLDEAEPLMRRAVQIGVQIYGSSHPNVALALNNLAVLLQSTNRLAEAEPLMRLALEIDEQSFGPDHPQVALRLNNLATLLADTDRPEEVESLMRRALAIDEQSYGPEHPNVARDLNNLAWFLYSMNRLVEAEPLMRRTLAIHEQSYGPDHPSLATDLNNLAQVLQDTGRLDEAEPLMRRSLAIDEQSYDENHPNVARDLNNLALLLKDLNRLDEAEPLLRRSLRFFLRYGFEHPDTKYVWDDYADLLTGLGLSQSQVRNRLNDVGREFGISTDDVPDGE